MFCPVCESEYEAGIAKCPDDNTELVERLTPSNTLRDNSEASFRLLHTLNAPAEAEMVDDLLRKNGIRSMVRGGGADNLSPALSGTGEGAAVLVDQRDYDRAKELYAAFFGNDSSPFTGATEEDEENDEDDD
ncbi:MAG TPA: DUF2007 domain-containing protein [Pyrinomonadaceae bacterium]|nr:DUF2007 domain-containing protein [Pyrinomonadaceae bacterium]